MASTIGIKIANGEFYPILEENSAVKKRLILTTAHNKQKSIHIDLYKTNTRTITKAFHIGSLVIENITSKPQGEPSIELVLASNQNGEILANAVDLDTANRNTQSLKVSLKSLHSKNNTPSDFTLEHLDSSPPLGLYEPAQDTKKFPWIIFVGLALIIICFILWFLFYGRERFFKPADTATAAVHTAQDSSNTKDAPVIAGESEAAVPPLLTDKTAASAGEPKPAVSEPQAQTPVITAPLVAPSQSDPPKRIRPAPPVASYKVPATIPRSGVAYTIRWGDTLWDISEAFYRNPWLYPRIARFNNISKPDIIISGTTIRIPPRR